MKQTMKKAVLLILICLMTSVLHAQEADAHIASLANNEEWFALAEDLPLYRDSMQAYYGIGAVGLRDTKQRDR